MRIVFVCGSMEPGKDGVGDYTRLLAAQLTKRGAQAAIIALNDRYTNTILTGFQQAGSEDVQVLRVPASMPARQRFLTGANFVSEFDPEWLSLQFVPFAWHNRGLKFGLSNWLKMLGAGRRWHIMFHELWVGMAIEESTKLFWWGKLQKLMIKSLVNNLDPACVHTQNRLYQHYLESMGLKAGYLPLFGNIPVISTADHEKIKNDIFKRKVIKLVVFGAVHPDAPIGEFANEAAEFAIKYQTLINLTFIGRNYPTQNRWVESWRAAGLDVSERGELTAKEISEVLSNSTVGISATPIAIIEKSGSFAAMRDHALPVISVAKSWHPRGMPGTELPPGVTVYQPGNFEACILNINHVQLDNSVEKTAAALISELSAND